MYCLMDWARHTKLADLLRYHCMQIGNMAAGRITALGLLFFLLFNGGFGVFFSFDFCCEALASFMAFTDMVIKP